jgi:hypothetical protein
MFVVPYILVIYIYSYIYIYLETSTKMKYAMELLEMTPHISSYALNFFNTCFCPSRFLFTRMTFRSLAFSYPISHNIISGIIYDTCHAIWECLVEKHMPFHTVLLVWMASTCASNAPNCLVQGTSITKASSL